MEACWDSLNLLAAITQVLMDQSEAVCPDNIDCI